MYIIILNCTYCLYLQFFYFPCISRTVSTFPFSLLDNLESLHLWNWGEVVHSLMVKSLDRASHQFRNQKNSGDLHLVDCVAVLQVCVLFNINYV